VVFIFCAHEVIVVVRVLCSGVVIADIFILLR
jgi:hypothetical protein